MQCALYLNIEDFEPALPHANIKLYTIKGEILNIPLGFNFQL